MTAVSQREWSPGGWVAEIANMDPIAPPPDEGALIEQDDRVWREVENLRVRHKARELFKVEQAREEGGDVEPDAGFLTDLLDRPAEPPDRVFDLIPSDGSTLIAAMRKTGKTTLTLNLAKSLLDGTDFLGRFKTREIGGTVGFLNYEVSSAQIARWANDVGVPHDGLYIENLRGKANPLTTPEGRKALAKRLRAAGVRSLIVDTFGRAFNGISQNDTGEVTSWLVRLEEFTRGDVGAYDLILTAHMGWNGERTRGSSALEDWPDSIIHLTRNDDEERFLRATGRDVEVDEDRLDFNPVTRHLTLAGVGSRRTVRANQKVVSLAVAVERLANENPGISIAGLEEALKEEGIAHQKGDVNKAARHAEKQGFIRIEEGGPGKANKHYSTHLDRKK